MSLSSRTIKVAATFTAEPIADPLEFWLEKLSIPATLEFAPYNQVFQELLCLEHSQTRSACLILLRLEDWIGKGDASIELIQNLQQTGTELIEVLRAAAAREPIPYLVCFCPPSHSGLSRFGEELPKLERQLAAQLTGISNVDVITSSRLLSLYPVPGYEDEYALKIAHIPYTQSFFVALATMIARRLYLPNFAPRKVIAVDCDHTLWDGVCGEDGPTGVTVDEPRRALQDFLIEQYDAGMLLCLVSKNVEHDVEAVFSENAGMRLGCEHFISSRINWRSKAANLRELAEELNLGLDSFLFIDDNPLECAEVRATLPEILVVELPADPARIPTFMHHLWAFDHWKLTNEDSKRNAIYREERARVKLRETSPNFEEFLQRLELKIDIRPAASDHFARLAQLTERTNQFNFTGIRRSATEIEALVRTGAVCLSVDVADRFGDYGLVGLAIATKQARALVVDTFLLSCRALGRGVERRMAASIGAMAMEFGLQEVVIPFRATSRNGPALSFLESLAGRAKHRNESDSSYIFLASALATASLVNNEHPVGPVSPKSSAASGNSLNQTIGNANLLLEVANHLASVQDISCAIELNKIRQASGDYGQALPRTPVEATLSSMWSSLLRTSRPGINDDFFTCGGDSLKAAQLVARIRQELGIELPIRAVFDAPTIADLAHRIETAHTNFPVELPAIPPDLAQIQLTESAGY